MVSQETSPSSSEPPDDVIEEGKPESENTEPEESPAEEPSEFKEFHVHESDVDPGEDAALALWGRFESFDNTEPFAVYLEFETPDFGTPGEDEDEEESSQSLGLLENLVAITSTEDKDYFNPSLDWNEFYSRLVSYNVESNTIPEATLSKYREILESYASEVRIQWLNEFVDSELEDEIENWLDALRDEFFSPDLGYYDLHLQFVDPNRKVRNDEDLEGAVSESSEQEQQEEGETVGSVKVSYVTNPSNGVVGSSLNVGQKVYFRIVGEAVEHLPDGLVDQESSKQRSVPMVGPITSIEDHPEEAEHLDSDPADYCKVSVEIEPTITGSALVFKDDHIKVPEDDSGGSKGNQDLLFFGFIFVIFLALIVFFIFIL